MKALLRANVLPGMRFLSVLIIYRAIREGFGFDHNLNCPSCVKCLPTEVFVCRVI